MVLISKIPLGVGANEELIEILLINLVRRWLLVCWGCILYLMAAVRIEDR